MRASPLEEIPIHTSQRSNTCLLTIDMGREERDLEVGPEGVERTNNTHSVTRQSMVEEEDIRMLIERYLKRFKRICGLPNNFKISLTIERADDT
jgi:hypothetical protein